MVFEFSATIGAKTRPISIGFSTISGVPESTMLTLAGHMSRAMLERYSHIRMAAKREPVESLSITKPAAAKSDGVVQESVQVNKTAKVN